MPASMGLTDGRTSSLRTTLSSMPHPSEDTIGWLLAQAARLHRIYLNERLDEMGLFAGQEQVLQVLDRQGALTMGELATILRVRAPTASKAVTRLAALNFVERLSERPSDAGDRRTVRVKLTRKGKAAAAHIYGLWDAVESDMTAEFDSKDRKRLRQYLLRAAANLTTALGGNEQNFDLPLEAMEDHHG